jgi:hypothetical protein
MNNIDYLLSTSAIRERSARLYDLTLRGEGQFDLHLEKLNEVADKVIAVINEKYPQWDIPYHSRWGHFKIGGKDRVFDLLKHMQHNSTKEKARALFDLVIISVLLDAGAGAEWQYTDKDGDHYSRSEGLAVASLEMFVQGKFSSDPVADPWRVDHEALLSITPKIIAEAFQVSSQNPLLGVEGRAALLVKLGRTLQNSDNKYFGSALHRPGLLVDYLLKEVREDKIAASQILNVVLRSLGPIWPVRISLEGVSLGDTWRHVGLGQGDAGLIPFHKLSQWLTYSLLEPMEMLGIKVEKLDELTPLAEYRNGGLLIDGGLITAKDINATNKAWQPDSTFVIEWRALTIVLIDRLAELIRQKMNVTKETLPLAKILEGGTWWTGRYLASEKRDGRPPIEIISDGTVF